MKFYYAKQKKNKIDILVIGIICLAVAYFAGHIFWYLIH